MKYKEGQSVKYDISDGVIRDGVIRGNSCIELPVIGASYIVEDKSGSFPNEAYPFSHLSIPEIFIKQND